MTKTFNMDVFKLILLTSSAHGYFDIEQISNSVVCDSIAELIVNINFHFFEDQHWMTLIDSEQKPIADVFKCLKGKFRPVNIFNNPSLVKIQTKASKSSVSYNPLNHGFLIKASS